MSEEKRKRKALTAFEDKTTPEQRSYGIYMISSIGGDFSQTYKGSYLRARRLARSRTQYGEMELSFVEPQDTPAQ
jgi:hypothetical protein